VIDLATALLGYVQSRDFALACVWLVAISAVLVHRHCRKVDE